MVNSKVTVESIEGAPVDGPEKIVHAKLKRRNKTKIDISFRLLVKERDGLYKMTNPGEDNPQGKLHRLETGREVRWVYIPPHLRSDVRPNAQIGVPKNWVKQIKNKAEIFERPK